MKDSLHFIKDSMQMHKELSPGILLCLLLGKNLRLYIQNKFIIELRIFNNIYFFYFIFLYIHLYKILNKKNNNISYLFIFYISIYISIFRNI